jgi:hypothetical protein
MEGFNLEGSNSMEGGKKYTLDQNAKPTPGFNPNPAFFEYEAKVNEAKVNEAKVNEAKVNEAKEAKEKEEKKKTTKAIEKLDKEDLEDEMNRYYALKQEYEMSVKQEKNRILKMVGLNWKEKRRLWSRFIPKCVNCKKRGGTLFSSTYNNDIEGRQLTAICNVAKPCSLKIMLNVGDIYTLDALLKNDEEEIENLKRKIILQKNDMLFGYLDKENAMKQFEQDNTEYNKLVTLYEFTLQTLLDLPNVEYNKEVRKNLKSLKREINEDIEIIRQQVTLGNFNEAAHLSEKIQKKWDQVTAIESPIRNMVWEDKHTYRLVKWSGPLDQLEKNFSL